MPAKPSEFKNLPTEPSILSDNFNTKRTQGAGSADKKKRIELQRFKDKEIAREYEAARKKWMALRNARGRFVPTDEAIADFKAVFRYIDKCLRHPDALVRARKEKV